MIFEEVALALQGSDMTQEQICQRVEDTLKVCGLYPFPQLAHFRTELWPEKSV